MRTRDAAHTRFSRSGELNGSDHCETPACACRETPAGPTPATFGSDSRQAKEPVWGLTGFTRSCLNDKCAC